MREQTARDMEHLREEVMKELTKVQAQPAEEIKQVKEQLHMMADTIASSAQTSPQPSYATMEAPQVCSRGCYRRMQPYPYDVLS
ncbi:hypothetical protein FOWG_17199 [Fusarium oxysporum f. sp. lycopersici MN25]|nr:hypothetical protein FOWG_17199 [Fusarium oxysporum f. sp. lycopersici MN25]